MATRQAHHELIGEIKHVRESVADFYKLSLDPDGDTFYMMKSVVYDMSSLSDPLGQIRGSGADVLTRIAQALAGDAHGRQVTDVERLGLVTQISRARDGLALVAESIGKSTDFKPELKAKLDPGMKAMSDRVSTALKLVEDSIVNAGTVNYDAQAYRKAYSEAIDEADKFNSTVATTLDEGLHASISDGRRIQFGVSAIILALAALCVALGTFIVRSVLRPVGHLVGVMEQVAKGDSNARAKLATPDEIGQLARQFDQMMDERESAAAKIQHEHDQLNESVLALLQAVAQLARKDLTTKVPVAEDVTGLSATP